MDEPWEGGLCPFYIKIGACRNGDRCNRTHNIPTHSSTLLLRHLYPPTADALAISQDDDWTDDMYYRAQAHIEAFHEELFGELASFGEVEDLVVADNSSEHMVGHAYVRYRRENDAAKALAGLKNRFYGDRLLQPEYSPVTDFREADCRAYREGRCARGGLCNFMHIKHVPKAIRRRANRTQHMTTRGRSRSPKKEAEGGAEGGAEASTKKRTSSEERRAMIAQWNLEEEEEAAKAK